MAQKSLLNVEWFLLCHYCMHATMIQYGTPRECSHAPQNKIHPIIMSLILQKSIPEKITKLLNEFKLKGQYKLVFRLMGVVLFKTLTVCSKALVSGHPSAVCIKCKLLCIMRRVMISVCLVSLSVLRYPHNVTYPSGCPTHFPVKYLLEILSNMIHTTCQHQQS